MKTRKALLTPNLSVVSTVVHFDSIAVPIVVEPCLIRLTIFNLLRTNPGNPRVLAENRKTRVQRNRQKAHKERLAKTSLVKAKKKFESQFGRIGVFKKEIKKVNQITRQRMREREQKMLDAMYQPRHIGRHRFKPQDVSVVPLRTFPKFS